MSSFHFCLINISTFHFISYKTIWNYYLTFHKTPSRFIWNKTFIQSRQNFVHRPDMYFQRVGKYYCNKHGTSTIGTRKNHLKCMIITTIWQGIDWYVTVLSCYLKLYLTLLMECIIWREKETILTTIYIITEYNSVLKAIPTYREEILSRTNAE